MSGLGGSNNRSNPKDKMETGVIMGYIMGLHRGNVKEHGDYYIPEVI